MREDKAIATTEMEKLREKIDYALTDYLLACGFTHDQIGDADYSEFDDAITNILSSLEEEQE